MPSGKQLSFQYGEVSPLLRFNSEEVSYASGLSKLTNMQVRRMGGVVNRSGLEFITDQVPQGKIPQEGESPGIRSFVFWDDNTDTWKTITYYYDTTAPAQYKFMVDGVDYPLLDPGLYFIGPEPIRVRLTQTRDKILVTPEMDFFSALPLDVDNQNVAIDFLAGNLDNRYGGRRIYTTTTVGVTGTSSGDLPALPASYVLTVEMQDGTELGAKTFNVTGYPHATRMVEANFTLSAADPEIKFFNLYRAAGTVPYGTGYFKLAARTVYDGTATAFTISDYGADDPTRTPPFDMSMLFYGPLGTFALAGVECAAYYQQRLIMGMRPNVVDSIKSGDLLASKLGAPAQIIAPIIYSDIGAFRFSIPITDGTPCIATLSMERLMAFTERGVFVVRGGEQGVLTPTSVNPLLVSEEGCSATVEPKMSGKKGYFINASHTKLMAIEFGVDGNLDIYEASTFSDHMIDGYSIIEIEILGSSDNKVYLLRRDGKLVSITLGPESVHGYSLIETNGLIESIYRGKAKKFYLPNNIGELEANKYFDVLMMYVIRNGTRVLEKLSIRDDLSREAEFFADSFSVFGNRLSKNGTQGYIQKRYDGTTFYFIANIESAGTWNAGDPVQVRMSTNIIDIEDPAKVRIHFYYDNAAGKEETLRFVWDGVAGVPVAGPDFSHLYSGYFESDIPVSLRDAFNASGITTVEKNKRLSRWLFAKNYLEGDANLYGPWLSASEDPSSAGSADVSIFADGEVVSSPLNPNKDTLSIQRDGFANLTLDLPDYYAWGYVGVPIRSEWETLDLESSGQRTLSDTNKLINAAGFGLTKTRGGFYGIPEQDLSDMEEIITRDDTSTNTRTVNFEGHKVVYFPSNWNEKGRVSVIHVDPTPLSILSVYPKGLAGD